MRSTGRGKRDASEPERRRAGGDGKANLAVASTATRPGVVGGNWTGISPARRVAFELLLELAGGRRHSDELLHSSRLAGLSGQDRNLTTALVMGVLRWQIALDARLQGLLARPDQRMAEEVWVALRLGAFQLLHMDRIPAHAALSESVAMCRASGQEHAAGMVNAVLRRLTREPAIGVKLFESPAAFATRLGHPAWMVGRWVEAYGRAQAIQICEGDQREPGRTEMFAELNESPVDGTTGLDREAEPFAGVASLPVMDDGSRLVAELAAAAMPHIEGRLTRVWDCCAAPGGKTAVLARRLADAEVLASDVSARRLRSTEERIGMLAASAGQGGRVRMMVSDATALPAEEGDFDLVLCDVPCSGTGTLARNPEIRHRLRLEDLSRQATRQRAILEAAMSRVAPGGRLVYSTCSLEPEECEAVVAGVAGEWQLLPVDAFLRDLLEGGILQGEAEWQSMIRDGALRTLPGVHGCDGFYAVVLERKHTV